MTEIRFKVTGIPRPGGSKIPGISKLGKLFVRPGSKHSDAWMAQVKAAAMNAYNEPLLSGPIQMKYVFLMPRPKAHFQGGKKSHLLREDAPAWHTGKPDLTKIIRSTEDALTGVIWKDDSSVCKRSEVKRYCFPGQEPGVILVISKIKNEGAIKI